MSPLTRPSLSSSAALLRSSDSLPRRSGPYRQIRTLRIGLWSSYFEPCAEKHLWHRQKDMMNIYKGLLTKPGIQDVWQRLQCHDFKKAGVKRFVVSAWRGQDRSKGRWTDTDDGKNSKSNKEEAERVKGVLGMLDSLRSQYPSRSAKMGRRMEMLENSLRDMASRTAPFKLRSSVFASCGTNIPHEDLTWASSFNTRNPENQGESGWNGTKEPLGEIDPITNRRVYKNKSGQGRWPSSEKQVEQQRIQFSSPGSPPEPKKDNPFVPEKKASGIPVTESAFARDFLKDFQGDDHKPVYGYEPDGQKPEKPDEVQQGLADYDAVTQYGVAEEKEGPVTVTQPHPVQEGLADYDAVTQYGVAEENEGPSSILLDCSMQESLPDYDGVTKHRVAEGNVSASGNEPVSSLRNSHFDYDKVTKYGVAEENGNATDFQPAHSDQDGHLDYDRVTKYGVAEERAVSDTKPASDSLTIDADALKHIASHTKPFDLGHLDYDGVTKYGAAEEHETVGDIKSAYRVQDDLEDYDNKASYGAAEPVGKVPSQKIGEVREESAAEKMSRRMKLEKDFKNSQELETMMAREFKSRLASIRNEPTVRSKKPEPKLTGNFGRDFPEEFEVTWQAEEDPSGHKILKMGRLTEQVIKNDIQIAEKEFIDGLAPKEAFASNPGTLRIELCLDRGGERSGDELIHSEEQAKKYKHRELVRELRGIYEEKYGAINSDHRQVLAPSEQPEPSSLDEAKSDVKPTATELPEPTLYKILAYDPTMQSISTAETTSIVNDSEPSLTPAEVLLRLSNPSKFFPHFEPLQSEGFEIVSGSGDVLVFRKVRAAGACTPGAKSETIPEYQDRTRQKTNPIDGMRPIAATGNFASPTGFVNYDRPDSADPPFKSNIDVRREEPVFSGKSTWSEDSERSRKKPSLGKRVLFGGAAVGGVSYAIGVVSEYFKSGGSDGRGPQGL